MSGKPPAYRGYYPVNRQAADFIRTLKVNNPTAFYTIEDVRQVKEGYMPEMKKQSSLK